MSRLDVLDALTVIILETQKKSLRQQNQAWECKHIDRLERIRTSTIHTQEADLFREVLEASRDIPKLETQQ